MKHLSTYSAILGMAFTHWLAAKEAPPASADVVQSPAAAVAEAEVKDPAIAAKNQEQENLAVDNKLQAERLIHATNGLRAEVAQLKLERELINEKMALETTKRQVALKGEVAKMDAEKERLIAEAELSKAMADKLASELKTVQTEAALEITRLQNDIARIETEEKRADFADFKPVYLPNPLKSDGTLVISDRRIPLNGMISTSTADFITSRIQYWNNKDRTLPIFIVIDTCPGGSVMAGYRILKAMESSDAPVHVVVKSFAASMAAAITTLAQESYAYPNAVILHHQISSVVSAQLNLTQQREFHQESQRWWTRLVGPIATKMGVTPDELIQKMYAKSSSGDWSEFGEQAKELKWVNHIVNGIDETSFNKDPDSIEAAKVAKPTALNEEVDPSGRAFAWLPRLEPKDVYFLYNSDGYYRMR